MLDKKQIRNDILKIRDNLTKDFVLENSRKITEKVLNTNEYKEANCIYIYMNTRNEVSTKDIIINALKKGKKVAIPKIENNKMEFYYISNIDEIKSGYFGIQEPIGNVIAKEKHILMIMPGVAFDIGKHRIGYGKGFYDRYLSENTVDKKIALAFSFQILNKIPYDNHDIVPDIIVTEKENIY